MTSGEEDLDMRLARLARATHVLGPRGGFTARVMAAVEREHPLGLIDALWTSSRRLFSESSKRRALGSFG